MHYYKRNLGDYAKKAGRLSMLQHGSYTLLIDACYDREQFPTLEEAIEWTWASTADEIEAVSFVLRKFFTLENGVYVQKRIQEEITEYHNKAETNKRIAIERETNRAEKRTNRAPSVNAPSDVGDESPPNHKPLTINHKPIKEGERAKALTRPDDVDEQVWSDWLQLRKAKKAPITETVLKTARKEAALADMPLVNFLEIWCARGSIGLEAAWLRNTDKSQASETVYQKSMWLRVAEISPALARPEPGRISPDDFFANLAQKKRDLANLTVLEIAL